MSYGPNCALSCNCVRASECNRFTGDCFCLPGWQGATCSNGAGRIQTASASLVNSYFLACSEGHFGLNCSFSCDCGKEKGCHHETGQCFCPRGFTGRSCNQGKLLCTYWVVRVIFLQFAPADFMVLIALKAANVRRTIPLLASNAIPSPVHVTANQDTQEIAKQVRLAASLHGQGKEKQNIFFAGCPDFTFGLNCSSACACTNGGVCNPVNGSCSCLPGYTGPQCETGDGREIPKLPIASGFDCLVCPSGFYGEDCRLPCSCLSSHTNTCSPIDGRCECLPGYQGEQCQEGGE